MIIILALKHGAKGLASSSCILIGIIIGYIICAILGMALPTTAVTADGVEYTKAWVLNWDKVAQASWFAIPEIMPVKPVFDLRAILPVMIMFIVTAVETVGDISGCIEGGMGREATDSELAGGVMCDGLGSTFSEYLFQPECGTCRYDKNCQPFCFILRRCLFNSLRSVSEVGGAYIHYASVRPWRRCGYYVFIDCYEWYSARYKGAADSQKYDHRIGGAGAWLRYRRKQRGAFRTSEFCSSHFRWFRNRTGDFCSNYSECGASERGSVKLIRGER